jgi:hypothetical protein
LALEDDGDDNKFQPEWQKKGSMTTWLLWDVMTSNYWIESTLIYLSQAVCGILL